MSILSLNTTTQIRPATPEDADQVAPLMILALGHIAGIFANSDQNEDAIPFMKAFFRRDDNQYSYLNTLVAVHKEDIQGSITGYDGARLHALRQPVLDQLRTSRPGFTLADETEAGEYYLDCINIDDKHQRKGIGKMLVNAFCERALSSGFKRVGLIVDTENPEAKRFYENLNFKTVGQKNFMGHRYFHMVKEVL